MLCSNEIYHQTKKQKSSDTTQIVAQCHTHTHTHNLVALPAPTDSPSGADEEFGIMASTTDHEWSPSSPDYSLPGDTNATLLRRDDDDHDDDDDDDDDDDHDDHDDIHTLDVVLSNGETTNAVANAVRPPAKNKPTRRWALPKRDKSSIAHRCNAPLRHVGGIPTTSKCAQHKPKSIINALRKINSEQRKFASYDRQLHPDHKCALKHREKDRTLYWARLRIMQFRRWLSLFINNNACGNVGFINETQAGLADAMCTRAAHQAVATPNSRYLHTGCPAMWAILLAQQVWCDDHGWQVECERARDRMSFTSMESVCTSFHRTETRLPEVHADETTELLKTTKQRTEGISRRFSSHSFGTEEHIMAKIDCLNSLLKASDPNGDFRGLHVDIARAVPPALIHKLEPGAKHKRCLQINEKHFARLCSSSSSSNSS